jgi:AcrR family transcriptional regulator
MIVPEKMDRRVRRTLQLLWDALVVLSMEKGYDNVTIRDITERADVAYITFFRHYESKHALLIQRVQETITELEAIAHRVVPDETPVYHETEGLYLFQHVQQHPNFYRLIVTSSARKQIQNALMNNIRRHLGKHTTTIPAYLAAHHSAVALIGLIEWWLEHDTPCTPEQMAQIYYQLIVKPVLDA